MADYANVLLISSDEGETVALERILSEHVNLCSVQSLSELQEVLESGGYDAVFCGWSFHQGTWNAALERVQQRCPDLPVIIFSRMGGEKEWVEALEAGAFDLLVAPYQKRNVLPLLEHAVVSHDARRSRNAAPCPKAVAS